MTCVSLVLPFWAAFSVCDMLVFMSLLYKVFDYMDIQNIRWHVFVYVMSIGLKVSHYAEHSIELGQMTGQMIFRFQLTVDKLLGIFDFMNTNEISRMGNLHINTIVCNSFLRWLTNLVSWISLPLTWGKLSHKNTSFFVLCIWVKRIAKIWIEVTHPDLVLYVFVLFLSRIPLRSMGRLSPTYWYQLVRVIMM